jgi:hypothetical protein
MIELVFLLHYFFNLTRRGAGRGTGYVSVSVD